MQENLARDCLVAVVKPLVFEQAKYLNRLKQEGLALMDREDLVWHSLLSSLSTMGRVDGYLGLICTASNYSPITYDALSLLSSMQERLRKLESVLTLAKVRRSKMKFEWFAENFDRVKGLGGLMAAKTALQTANGKVGKIDFLKSFKGIGDKYARSIMMDMYPPEFRDSIAIDERIKAISRELDILIENYELHERFYLDVAHELEIEGWELDRLLFGFKFDVLCGIRLTKQ